MGERRKYRHPRIEEALCEMYFGDSKDWDDTAPGRFYERVKAEYPIREGAAGGERPDPPPFFPAGQDRDVTAQVRFLAKDGRKIVQIGRDILVVNRLAPYSTFEDWEPAISEGLRAYREVARPASLRRVGLRYVNVIRVPSPEESRYFRVHLQTPPDLRGKIQVGSLVRFEIASTPERSVIVTLEHLMESESLNAFVLDIHAMYEPERGADPERAKNEWRRCREDAVEAFEASITDQLRHVLDHGV